jgi:hypothetical protein
MIAEKRRIINIKNITGRGQEIARLSSGRFFLFFGAIHAEDIHYIF